MKLEVADRSLVDIEGVVNLTFNSDSHTYRWGVLVVEEKGLLGNDYLFAQNFELSKKWIKINGQVVKTEIERLYLEKASVCAMKRTVIPAFSQVILIRKSKYHYFRAKGSLARTHFS